MFNIVLGMECMSKLVDGLVSNNICNPSNWKPAKLILASETAKWSKKAEFLRKMCASPRYYIWSKVRGHASTREHQKHQPLKNVAETVFNRPKAKVSLSKIYVMLGICTIWNVEIFELTKIISIVAPQMFNKHQKIDS
jgi:hypothetical protein